MLSLHTENSAKVTKAYLFEEGRTATLSLPLDRQPQGDLEQKEIEYKWHRSP